MSNFASHIYHFSSRDPGREARSLQQFARTHGALWFCHLAHPMHSAPVQKLQPIQNLNAKTLARSEADGCCLPNGGLCTPHSSRAGLIWDPRTPAAIFDKILYIPAGIFAPCGACMDDRGPLLASCRAVSRAAKALLAAVGETATRVVPLCAAEREFFLLPQTGSPHRHYMAPLAPGEISFARCVKQLLDPLGIALCAFHKEAAPAQFEVGVRHGAAAHIADTDFFVSAALQRAADRCGYTLNTLDKPFANVSGSGKHINWSLLADGQNLLNPGCPHAPLFVSAGLLAAVQYGGLLCAACATKQNDARLGSHEAPAFCMSVSDGGTRDRTAAFALVADRFEFRTPGSSANTAFVLTALGCAMAGSFYALANYISRSQNKGDAVNQIVAAAQKCTAAPPAAAFENSAHALSTLDSPANTRLFSLLGVLSPRELAARKKTALQK